MIEKLSRSGECTIPSGIQYSTSKHFLNFSVDYEVPEDPAEAQKTRNQKVSELEKYIWDWEIDTFNAYLDFQKQKGAEGHRITVKDGVRLPHVTDVLSIEFPPPAIANLEEYGRLGSACDRLWKNYAKTSVWTPEDYKDSGAIKTTYADIVEHSAVWMEDNAKHVRFTDCALECYSPDYGYIGELDLLGTYDGSPTIFDVKSTKEIKGKVLTKYLCQLAAYAKCYPDIEQVVIISPFNKPIVETDIDKYFHKFLMIRGAYKERYGL